MRHKDGVWWLSAFRTKSRSAERRKPRRTPENAGKTKQGRVAGARDKTLVARAPARPRFVAEKIPGILDKVYAHGVSCTHTGKGVERVNKNPKERTENVNIRVTPAEKEKLKALALAAGVSVTGYVLGCALGDAIGQTMLDGFDRKAKKKART